MADQLTRLFDFELRSGGDGRTLTGVAVPYDRPTEIGGPYGFVEVFRSGAFARTIQNRGNRVRILAQHSDKTLPVGKADRLWEDAAGLMVETRISDTTLGNDVLTLIRDGALDGLSVGFVPVRERVSDEGWREVLEAKLMEISVVATPAYDDARVLSVRGVPLGISVEEARAAMNPQSEPGISVAFAHKINSLRSMS